MRQRYDHYPTPAWCVRRLLDHVGDSLPWDGSWLEPAVGGGAIVGAVAAWRGARSERPPEWTTADIRPEVRPDICCDYTLGWGWPGPARFDLVITNPPFSLAYEFARVAMRMSDCVILLVRLGWLASEKRAEWLRDHPPRLLVLPNRPRFVAGKHTTDQTDYGWLCWGLGDPTVEILATTPRAERAADERVDQ